MEILGFYSMLIMRKAFMAKKIVVVNAGPRKGDNTDTLLCEAAKRAESATGNG
jgi:hypothetical protein